MVEVFYPGKLVWILRMAGASESFDEACAGVPGNRNACPAQLMRLTERLGDFGTLHSEDQFRHEGSAIYAIKARCGLRAYGWFAAYRGHKAFVINHYVLKKRARFDPKDRARVEANRIAFQEVK